MRLIAITLFVSLLGVGCAKKLLYKAGAQQGDFEKDMAVCEYQVQSSLAGYNTGPTAQSMGGAMGQGFGEGLYKGLEGNRLMLLCMNAKGWYEGRPPV